MKVWRKKSDAGASKPGRTSALLTGASREELLREAVNALKQDRQVDRIGVWLEPDLRTLAPNEPSSAFHGAVWDRALKDECPPEWKVLSLEPFLPGYRLISREPFEQNLEDSKGNPVIGQLLGLRRALWVPLAGSSKVSGWILLGSRGKPLASSLEAAKSLAKELALAFEREDQLRAARMQKADLMLARQTLETAATSSSIETSLTNLLADAALHSSKTDGVGAAFAMIGVLQPPGDFGLSATIDFRWRTGDEAWTRSVEIDPLAKVWGRALESRRIIGSEPPVTWPQASVARVIALPLEAEGQLLGVLVAGLPCQATSLATLDRLELRAQLAAFLLQQNKQQEEGSRRAATEQALLEFVGEPLFLLDGTGRITAASRGVRELLRRAGQLTLLPSGNLSDLFCGRDRERLKEWLQQARDLAAPLKEVPQAELRNGIVVRLHLLHQAPGGMRIVSLLPEPAFERESHTGHVEAELQSVIEWLEEGVVLFDALGRVRAINSRFEQLVGLSPEESAGARTLEDLIARLEGQAAQPTHFAERWRELAKNIQGDVREQVQLMRPAARVLERAARPILDALGRYAGRVEIYRDLTAQGVLQSKLLQTEKLAALGQMVSGIAHELSSPLTSILGYARRLLAGKNSPESTEEVRQIYQQAERAAAILRQLLLNSRETIPERRLVSLNQIVMHATELQRFSLAAQKIRVELDLDPALPFIHADAGQFQQVLINLMGNARQALEERGQGGIIRLRTRKASGRRVLLEVEDNGPGIPKAIQERIFDPFFTTKPAGVGTGLGLSIVLAVVRDHGGQVGVQNSPQGGALFQIEIPAASERQQEDALNKVLRGGKLALAESAPFTSPASPRVAPFEPSKDIRVLVVEDEPTVARLIGDVLEDEGMQVDVLLDGRKALDRAAAQSYDLVICDMKMPGLDGQHFYRSLERSGNPLRERFLFVTGDVMAAQTREFLERNRLPHVAKPFRVEELLEKVHAVLPPRAHQEPAAADGARKNVATNG